MLNHSCISRKEVYLQTMVNEVQVHTLLQVTLGTSHQRLVIPLCIFVLDGKYSRYLI